jgi:hypothetical protein
MTLRFPEVEPRDSIGSYFRMFEATSVSIFFPRHQCNLFLPPYPVLMEKLP